ncbi:MAG: hypothetical protein H6811_02880 [Phycisphaeraceae bacterium]|nr:hypothetical protein [Phycisphaeraceae bacterium]
MQTTLDGVAITPAGPTLRDSFDEAVARAGQNGRVIVEVTLDGIAIDEDWLEDPPEEVVSGTELAFVSADPHEMIAQTMLDAVAALEDARTHQAAAGEAVLEGRLDAARSSIEPAIEIWQSVVAAITSGCELIGLRLDSLRAGDPPVPLLDEVSGLARNLQELHRALEGEEWPTVGDILRFDLPPRIDAWGAHLRAIADRAKRPDASAP